MTSPYRIPAYATAHHTQRRVLFLLIYPFVYASYYLRLGPVRKNIIYTGISRVPPGTFKMYFVLTVQPGSTSRRGDSRGCSLGARGSKRVRAGPRPLGLNFDLIFYFFTTLYVVKCMYKCIICVNVQ